MSDKAHVHALMMEIGPVLELAEVQEFEQEDLWTLTARDGTVLFVDYEPEDQRLWLSADVCLPLPGDRLQLYEIILQYNARWRETGGVRLALDGPDGGVVQAFDLPVAGLDLSRLQCIIRNFCQTLDTWREIVARGFASGTPAASTGTLDPMMMMGGMIRC
jgi:hypothetical protein